MIVWANTKTSNEETPDARIARQYKLISVANILGKIKKKQYKTCIKHKRWLNKYAKKNLFFTEYIYGHINVHIEKYVCMCVYRQAELIPY